MIKNEVELKRKIIEKLNKQPGVFAFRVEQRPGMGRGVSDILACCDGRFVCIEAKMPGRKLTPLQVRFMDKVADNGGEALLVKPNDLEDLWI